MAKVSVYNMEGKEVGNMEKRKGVDLLIKGYLQYKNRGGKKKLILGGKMQEEEINQIVRSAMMWS